MIEMSGSFFQAHRLLSEKPKIRRIGSVGSELGGSVDLALFLDITTANFHLVSPKTAKNNWKHRKKTAKTIVNSEKQAKTIGNTEKPAKTIENPGGEYGLNIGFV